MPSSSETRGLARPGVGPPTAQTAPCGCCSDGGPEARVPRFEATTELGSAPSLMADFLYHATYRAYLGSILTHGLGGASPPVPANYEDSEAGVVYLADCPEVARSYAESAEHVPEAWLDDIVVMRVRSASLEPGRLSPDANVRCEPDEPVSTFAYRGVVPPDALGVLP